MVPAQKARLEDCSERTSRANPKAQSFGSGSLEQAGLHSAFCFSLPGTGVLVTSCHSPQKGLPFPGTKHPARFELGPKRHQVLHRVGEEEAEEAHTHMGGVDLRTKTYEKLVLSVFLMEWCEKHECAGVPRQHLAAVKGWPVCAIDPTPSW